VFPIIELSVFVISVSTYINIAPEECTGGA